MARSCKCGETFDTLSGYRLHQRNECDGREIHDISGKSDDDIVNEIIAQLLKCEKCEKKNETERLESLRREIVNGDQAIVARFPCSCGFQNRNVGFLE